MDLLEVIGTREPEYDERYYDFILEYTVEQGAKMGTASEEEKWLSGKFFSTRYEMYMYAVLLGLKKDYRIAFDSNTKKRKFLKIDGWNPTNLANYIIASVMGKMEIDIFELENLTVEEVGKKATEIKKTIEEYANGGFDLIRAKAEEEGEFFKQNDMSFIELLDM
jgi:enoyl reductase-like protein